jgi:hypothetical protein
LKFGFGHGLAESYDSRNVVFQGDPSWGARAAIPSQGAILSSGPIPV